MKLCTQETSRPLLLLRDVVLQVLEPQPSCSMGFTHPVQGYVILAHTAWGPVLHREPKSTRRDHLLSFEVLGRQQEGAGRGHLGGRTKECDRRVCSDRYGIIARDIQHAALARLRRICSLTTRFESRSTAQPHVIALQRGRAPTFRQPLV